MTMILINLWKAKNNEFVFRTKQRGICRYGSYEKAAKAKLLRSPEILFSDSKTKVRLDRLQTLPKNS